MHPGGCKPSPPRGSNARHRKRTSTRAAARWTASIVRALRGAAHRSRLAGFIIDCDTPDLDAAARFWSGALGLRIADPDAGGTGRYAELGDAPGGLHVEVQKVDHASRVHLDIETDDLDAEVARLEALGARRVAFMQRWWVMEAPTGQRFCVVPLREDATRAPARVWE